MIANKNWNNGRKITKSDVAAVNHELILLYDKAMKSGEKEDMDKYMVALWAQLENLVKDRIKANQFQLSVEWEDLMSAGKVVVLDNALKYDPRVSLPSSFYMQRIDGALRDVVGKDSHISDHYRNTAIALNKIVKEYGYDDMKDPRLTPEMLAKFSDIPLKTILETLKQFNYQTVSYGDEWIGDKSEGFENPLSAYLKNEQYSLLSKIFLKLSEYEKFLMRMKVFEGKSFNSIAAMLKDEETRKTLGIDTLTTAKDPNTIRDDYEKVINFMKNYPEMKKMYGYERRQKFRNYTVVEQAPIEYIEEALFDEPAATGTES